MKFDGLRMEAEDYKPPKDGKIVRREKYFNVQGDLIHDILYFDPPDGETVRSDKVGDGERFEIWEYDKNDQCILRTYFISDKKQTGK